MPRKSKSATSAVQKKSLSRAREEVSFSIHELAVAYQSLLVRIEDPEDSLEDQAFSRLSLEIHRASDEIHGNLRNLPKASTEPAKKRKPMPRVRQDAIEAAREIIVAYQALLVRLEDSEDDLGGAFLHSSEEMRRATAEFHREMAKMLGGKPKAN